MAVPSHVPPSLHPPLTLPQCLAGTGAWQRINTAVKLHSPRYPVFDLQDGQKYQFRVYSVNLYGSSEASEPSEPVQKVDEDGKGWDQCTHPHTHSNIYTAKYNTHKYENTNTLTYKDLHILSSILLLFICSKSANKLHFVKNIQYL